MRADLLCEKMQAAGIGIIGTSIFDAEMPFDVKSGVMIRLPLAGVNIDPFMPGYFRAKIQLISRSPLMSEGRALIESVVRCLSTERVVDYVDGAGVFQMRINRMMPVTLPISYPRSVGGSVEWSVSFDTTYVMKI